MQAWSPGNLCTRLCCSLLVLTGHARGMCCGLNTHEVSDCFQQATVVEGKPSHKRQHLS